MTREEFVEGYMSRSKLVPYTLDGEIVTYVMDSGEPWIQHALKCHCGEDGCEGWAMITNGCHNWHKFQNGLTDMSYPEVCEADAAARKWELDQ